MKRVLNNHMLVTAFIAAMIGIGSATVEARAEAVELTGCGDSSMCYSVPGGCGQGVGCQTAYCYMSACPSILGGDGICKFCQEPE